MDELCLRPGPEPALVLRDRTLDHSALAAHAARFAALARSGEEPLAFVAESSLDTIALVTALLDAGRPFLPLHPRLSARERSELVRRAGAREVAVVPGAASAPSRRGAPASAVAVLLATSGTSGEPKLALLERRNLLASARASAENLGWRDDDAWLSCMPLAHAGGLSVITRSLVARRPVVSLPRFEPDAVLDAIVRQRATLISVVPTMLRLLLDRDEQNVLAGLRAVLVGGAHCPRELRLEAAALGVRIHASYGLTETASQVVTQRAGADPSLEDSGHPLAGVELALAPSGAIRVRGPMLMRGYLGEPPLEPGAFFETGDLGALDAEGRLHVLGRLDDVIVSGGENVHPAAVEQAVRRSAGVRACLVFGVPDPVFGQVVAVALVLDGNARPEDVLERAGSELASFERPRRFARVDALPLGPSGKPDRRRARDELASRLRAAS